MENPRENKQCSVCGTPRIHPVLMDVPFNCAWSNFLAPASASLRSTFVLSGLVQPPGNTDGDVLFTKGKIGVFWDEDRSTIRKIEVQIRCFPDSDTYSKNGMPVLTYRGTMTKNLSQSEGKVFDASDTCVGNFIAVGLGFAVRQTCVL